jgi:hypothetical protein
MDHGAETGDLADRNLDNALSFSLIRVRGCRSILNVFTATSHTCCCNEGQTPFYLHTGANLTGGNPTQPLRSPCIYLINDCASENTIPLVLVLGKRLAFPISEVRFAYYLAPPL